MVQKSAKLANSPPEDTQPLASPVLKWAGGKSQLLPILNSNYPDELLSGKIHTYIEPFIGGGAVFFDIANKYRFNEAFLFDTNPELVILYNSIKHDVESVIKALEELSYTYFRKSQEARKDFFYEIRDIYNQEADKSHGFATAESPNPLRAAHTIFLNRTCFNGLFRVNSKGGFNVPYGSHANPNIVFSDRLVAVSQALKKAVIKLTDFSSCEEYISGKTFIYYDPPYRPITQTSHFTAYARGGFNDDDQIRLADTYKRLHSQGVLQLLSNSDPSNYVEDPFFDELYAGFNIMRVDAKRMINSDAAKRGTLKEILVKNY